MQVFKFGGASINSIERIENVGKIIQSFTGEKILIIISAMGKTTNALEKVVDAFFSGDTKVALELFEGIKNEHDYVLKQLTNKEATVLKDFYTEIEWLLHDKPVREYDYYYDQIVCSGELLSTAMVSSYLNEIGVKNNWIDVRDILRTDDNFRDAVVDWNFTQQKIESLIKPLFDNNDIVITQGFIGATDENESTTLGREGSDYTAAIFANMLDAKNQTIWKDVEGVMNADPKEFTDAQIINYLSYNEVIEMAFYGAQVIHPKTIKPLQNKQIPLHVKCFLNPALPGTVIGSKAAHSLPPIIVVKNNQALLQLSSKDFSFVGEEYVGKLYELLAELKIKPNLTQNGAISILCCLDDKPEKIEKLALAASQYFDVVVEKDLTLLTVRHYTKEKFDELTLGKQVILTQRTLETVQALMR
ncbi:MAG: aspartate kinase [Ferruginibacter sp.]|nr:aspartate kinase [Ferruginibacter sp.]